MKIIIRILVIILLIIVPIFVFADCNQEGTTVIFINGMLTPTRTEAERSKNKLENLYATKGKNSNISFTLGYNPSHFGGLGDMINAINQAYGDSSMDYDLTNILRQTHRELQTKKILLIGHSQGSFYTNTAYEYLINNEVDEDSIAVYNIGTPANRVSGNGKYLTSSTDKVINWVRGLTTLAVANKPLPSNITFKLSPKEDTNPLGGHSFSGVYLAEAADRIIGDMDEKIAGLKAGDEDKNECFIPPDTGFIYQIKDTGYKIGDTVTDFAVGAMSSLYNTTATALKYVYNFGKETAATFVSNIRQLFNRSSLPPASVYTFNPDNGEQNDTNQSNDSITPGPVGNENQENLDDYLELQDILNSKNNNKNQPTNNSINQNSQPPSEQQQPQTTPPAQLTSDTNNGGNSGEGSGSGGQTPGSSGGGNSSGGGSSGSGGGSVTRPTYPKILITEVQILPIEERFVELYNPNSTAVELTDWYVQRKTKTATSWDSFITSTQFEGKTIQPDSYFLVARSSAFNPDILLETLTLSEDNVILLKNPNREEVDKVGWGQAQEFKGAPTINPSTGKSVGRIWDETNQAYKETNNNSVDFEEQDPTPRAKNVLFVPLPPPPPPPTPTDTVAPTVVFNLDSIQTTLNFAVNFEITDLSVENVSPSGLAIFQFRWQQEGGEWQADPEQVVDGAPLTYSGARDFTAPQDEIVYYFQVKAKDINGNESVWLPETPVSTRTSLPKTLVINEIQVNENEFIELYNYGEYDLNIRNLYFSYFPATLDENGNPKYNWNDPYRNKSFFESTQTIISAKGYYLIGLKGYPIMNGNPNADWQPYSSDQLSNSAGAVAIFPWDPKTKTPEEAEQGRIDAVGWGNATIKEGSAAPAPPKDSSIERKKLGQDTNDNSVDFRISAEPTPKSGSPKVYIQDATNYLTCMSGSLPGTTYYNLKIKWRSLSQNIDFYQVQYKLNDGDWQDWIPQTTKTEETFRTTYSLFNDKIYKFRARAQDKDGNQGGWSEIITVDVTNPVVINEITFYGTGSETTNDQWIELYNRTDQPIDLTGWKVVSGRDLNIDLQGTIPANGYFLLEKDSDDVISDIPADQIFTGSGLRSGYLYLRTKNNRQTDQTFAPSYPGWTEQQFVKDGNYYSLERISAYSFGLDSKNWRLNNGVIKNGENRQGQNIFGTPASQNSVYQIYTSNYLNSFVEDTTLKESLSPYLLRDPYTAVDKGVTLTIEPGAVIKFYDSRSSLIINGILKAVGTENEKIIFTSYYDDEYGGDINEDGTPQEPYPGAWLGLYFTKDSSSSNSELENVEVRYAGACWPGYPYGGCNLGAAGIRVEQTSISLKNSTIQNNSRNGLWLTNTSSIIDSVQILDHQLPPYDGFFLGAKGILIEGGSPTIRNSNIAGNYYGLYINRWYDSEKMIEVPATPIIENNTFEQNSYPIWLGELSFPSFSGNQAINNGILNGIILGGNIRMDLVLKSDPLYNLPYIIKNNISVFPDISLTIEPGATVKFSDSALTIQGTLKALGTTDAPIIFTSNSEQPAPGQWRGLYFTKTSRNSELENIQLRYAGGFWSSYNNDFGAGIKVDRSVISLRNSTIERNANNGLWLINSPSIIDFVQILDNKLSRWSWDPEKGKGIYIEGGSPTITNSSFGRNYYGIYMQRWFDENGVEVLANPILGGNVFEDNSFDIWPSPPSP